LTLPAQNLLNPALDFPFPEPPATGSLVAVAPGILWTRIPLPFRLDHVNIFLIEDGDGWAVVDTGIADEPTMAVWQSLIDGPLAGRKLTRLIVTHFHPDHIGLAGWLCERLDIPLYTSLTTYLSCINLSLRPDALADSIYQERYRRNGLSAESAEIVAKNGHRYLRMVSGLPSTFHRLLDGDVLTIGGRRFTIMASEGHAEEQLLLWCEEDGLFLAADEVLAKITPNISVSPTDPDGDPLGLYYRSLRRIKRRIPDNVLVLPGHQLPFYGLHTRCDELMQHHDARLLLIEEACKSKACTIADLVPVMFRRPLDAHQMSFAFAEVHAHVNYLVRRGELVWTGEDSNMLVPAQG
jgi:glyoxylase-like metal-dependent hydrolase (beta-lactamase superfamily II)